jgi:hypothetical protein
MYHVEWLAGPKSKTPQVVGSIDLEAATLQEAMAEASALFPEVSADPRIEGFRICKTGQSSLLTWWSKTERKADRGTDQSPSA